MTRLVPLADLIARGPDDQEPAPGFVASLRGEDVEVTAVLERTAVVAPLGDRWADKLVVLHGDLLVDPPVITWRPKAPTGFRAKFRRRYTSDQRQTLRAASDRRARADQARRAATEAEARPATALPRDASPAQPDAGAATPRPAAAAAPRQRPITAPVDPALRPAASTPQASASTLAAELQRARQRVAELEAELERHRAVALDMVRRVEVAVGRRAA